MESAVETYLNAARQHGEDSEPDHEVGDLQQYLRIALSLMTDDQKAAFAVHPEVVELLAAT